MKRGHSTFQVEKQNVPIVPPRWRNHRDAICIKGPYAMAQVEPTFAIVRTDNAEFDVAKVARVLADSLDLAVVDLVQLLPQRSGILAEDLLENVANRCAVLLADAGVAVCVVPQSAVVEPPELFALRSGRVDEEVFFYVGSGRKGVVKWSGIVWTDLVSVQETATEEFDDWDFQHSGEGGAFVDSRIAGSRTSGRCSSIS